MWILFPKAKGKRDPTSWVIELEAGGQERGLVQEPDQVLDGSVTAVGIGLLLEFSDDWVVRVDLHSLLADHVAAH